MKNLLNNQYIKFGLILFLGLLLGWVFFAPSGEKSEVNSVHEHTTAVEEWTCSMHPQIRQPEAGSCPICGMALIPVEEDGSGSDVAITMSENAMKLANIVTAKVGVGNASEVIRTTGKVEEDERQQFVQSAHIPGRVENLNVNFKGQYVKRGQQIGTIYSPDLITAQKELKEAESLKSSNPSLYESALRKLRNWKLSASLINQILKAEQPIERFPILSDASGYINEMRVDVGDYVKLGAPLFDITDLSAAWVMLDIYEKDLAKVKTGDYVSLTISPLPGREFNGEISYIDPVVNQQSRVSKARVTVSNNNYELKPGMLVSGEVYSRISGSDKITIPESAVLWTGKRSVVYVLEKESDNLSFAMREVKLGESVEDGYVILEGIEIGEEIAINGTFSIDAAAQLAGKPSMMNREQKEDNMFPSIVKSDTKYSVKQEFKDQLKAFFRNYLALKNSLVKTDALTAKKNGEQLNKQLKQIDMNLLDGQAHVEWMKELKVYQAALDHISETNDIEMIRLAFYTLSDQLYHSLIKYNVETGGYRQYCPMAFDNEGGFWLSDSEEIQNPYFGDLMLTCGNVEEVLK